jgi:hypothetical protein
MKTKSSPSRATKITATKLVEAIQANVAAFYADTIDHDTFGANQRVLWAAVKGRPRFHQLVLTKLRNA